jgi:inorganic pyrophosphatase
MGHPTDYGFVEGTAAEEGDRVDRLVLAADPTFPGCGVPSRPIGIFHMDEEGGDDKLVCVPVADVVYGHLVAVEQIRRSFRDEIEHSYRVYKTLEGKPGRTFGFGSRPLAETMLQARRRASETRKERAWS